MITSDIQAFDRKLSQIIKDYMEMEPDDAYVLIAHEWPEQMAVLLIELLFRSVCNGGNDAFSFIHVDRQDGFGTYVALACDCNRQPVFIGHA